MKDVSGLAGSTKQGHDGSWSQTPRSRCFRRDELTSGQCVLMNRQKKAPKPASCRRMRSCAPVDFTLKKTEFTSPDVVLHFGACLLATLQFLQPRFASSRSEERRVGKECRSRGPPSH